MDRTRPCRRPCTGGNMDCRHTCVGATVYLPVEVSGALFSTGDGHLAQGDGEVCGIAMEAPLDVTMRFKVLKTASIPCVRFDTCAPTTSKYDGLGYPRHVGDRTRSPEERTRCGSPYDRSAHGEIRTVSTRRLHRLQRCGRSENRRSSARRWARESCNVSHAKIDIRIGVGVLRRRGVALTGLRSVWLRVDLSNRLLSRRWRVSPTHDTAESSMEYVFSAADEHPHAPDASKNFNESVYVNGFDPQQPLRRLDAHRQSRQRRICRGPGLPVSSRRPHRLPVSTPRDSRQQRVHGGRYALRRRRTAKAGVDDIRRRTHDSRRPKSAPRSETFIRRGGARAGQRPVRVRRFVPRSPAARRQATTRKPCTGAIFRSAISSSTET